VLDGGSYTDFEALGILEKELDLPMSIGEHFDIANGRGIGAWVIFEKLCKGEEFSEDYQNIRRNMQDQTPAVSRFSGSTLTSHEVTLKRLEGAFKVLNTIFGDKTLFEFGHGSIKLCITVSRTKDSTTCVLSNYNGEGIRQKSYEHIREQKIKTEVQLSQW
jgi:hypothetical protein